MADAPYIVIEREFNASPQRLYDAWTDASQILQWFHGSPEMVVKSAEADVREGGRYRIEVHSPSDQYVVQGTYTDVRPPDVLEFTWKWDESTIEPGETLVRLEFQPIGERTRMRLTHTNFTSERATQVHDAGWGAVLSTFTAFIEQDQTL